MPAPYAFVSLVTSDHYLPGALALAAALKDLHPTPPTPPEVDFQTLCIVTPEAVDVSTIKLLRRAFDVVVGVELIEQEDEKGLQLLGESPVKNCRLYWIKAPNEQFDVRPLQNTPRTLRVIYSPMRRPDTYRALTRSLR